MLYLSFVDIYSFKFKSFVYWLLYRVIIPTVASSSAAIPSAEMSGQSYFAIQIKSWFVKTQSKINHSTQNFSNLKSPSPNEVQKIWKTQPFHNKNATLLFN